MNMRKKYIKPDVQLVDFSLSSSIANSCGAGSANNNGWGADFDNSVDCSCTHVPTADTALVGS